MNRSKFQWTPTSPRIVVILFLALFASPVRLAAQSEKEHHHCKLIVLGTLGGPQSYGDAGHGAANLTRGGTAAGDADTSIPDPFFPNFNPLLTGGLIGSYPFVYHAFTTNGNTLIDLESLPGANSSTPSYARDDGLVSGKSLNGAIDPVSGWPQMNAVLWKDERIINLGTLGGYESISTKVNRRGQVLGNSTNDVPDAYSFVYLFFAGITTGTQNRAFLWDQRNGMQDLGTLGGPDAVAADMNERGQIVGQSYTSFTPNPNTRIPTIDPFLWDYGKMIDLGTFGGTSSSALSINERGQVIGGSNLPGDTETHPFIWDKGKLTDIGTLGGTFGAANALNEAGHVAGQATTADGSFHAFLWRNGAISDLGLLPGFGDSTCIGAFGMNAHDQVVGQAVQNLCQGPGAHAFLWEHGDMIDLNQFVPPGSDITLNEVERINDRGEMFGIGTLANGDSRAFLLIPCDEDHPNIEGCDYTTVDTSTAASLVIPAPAAKTALVSNPHFPRQLHSSPATTLSPPHTLTATSLDTYQIKVNWQEASGQSLSGSAFPFRSAIVTGLRSRTRRTVASSGS